MRGWGYWGALLVCLPGVVWAHSGRLDGSGCHHDRQRGGYHCHGGYTHPIPDSSIYAPPPSSQWMEEHRERRREERALEERRQRNEIERERRRRAADREREEGRSAGGRESGATNIPNTYRADEPTWDSLVPPGFSAPRVWDGLPSGVRTPPSVQVMPPARQEAPLSRPSGGMEGGLRELINARAGGDACAWVSAYALVPGGAGFLVRCANGEARFHVRTQGRSNRVEACVPDADLHAPC